MLLLGGGRRDHIRRRIDDAQRGEQSRVDAARAHRPNRVAHIRIVPPNAHLVGGRLVRTATAGAITAISLVRVRVASPGGGGRGGRQQTAAIVVQQSGALPRGQRQKVGAVRKRRAREVGGEVERVRVETVCRMRRDMKTMQSETNRLKLHSAQYVVATRAGVIGIVVLHSFQGIGIPNQARVVRIDGVNLVLGARTARRRRLCRHCDAARG